MPVLPIVASPKAKIIIILAGVGILIILAALLVLKGFSRPKQGETVKKPVITPTPTPLPLAPGKQVYEIRSDTKAPGPQILQATFDPLDVEKGEQITVTVKAKDASTLTVTMIDDSGPTDHLLTSTPTGIWASSWKTETTHTRIYGATIVAKNAKAEERKVELWFR